jgi:hypothetical protein
MEIEGTHIRYVINGLRRNYLIEVLLGKGGVLLPGVGGGRLCTHDPKLTRRGGDSVG